MRWEVGGQRLTTKCESWVGFARRSGELTCAHAHRIPTAIVIKNIPFHVPKETLSSIMVRPALLPS